MFYVLWHEPSDETGLEDALPVDPRVVLSYTAKQV